MFFWRVHLSPISFQDKENWTKMLSFVSQSPLTIAIEKICVCEHFKNALLLQFKFQAKIDTCFEVISIATFKTFLRIFDQLLVSPIKKCHKRHKCVCKCKRRFLLRREKKNLDLRSKTIVPPWGKQKIFIDRKNIFRTKMKSLDCKVLLL